MMEHGFVYIFEMVGTPYYKIGRSINYRCRLKQLQEGFPFELKVIFVFKTTHHVTLESWLHHKMSSKRYKYEWFTLDKKDLAEIRRVMKYGVSQFVPYELQKNSYEIKPERKTTINKF